MLCKFHAATMPVRPSIPLMTASAALALSWPAAAEKADRTRPVTLESNQGCMVDLVKQTRQCSGGVVITQGTLLIRAERVEMRETTDGYQLAAAIGTADKPAQYRQKRDGVDEHVEGTAQRIDYDGRAGTLRFDGRAVVRRLRGAVMADEIQGSTIVWDSIAEQFTVQGGASSPGNPSGRVRAVLSPRESASAPAAAASVGGGAALRSTPALGERR